MKIPVVNPKATFGALLIGAVCCLLFPVSCSNASADYADPIQSIENSLIPITSDGSTIHQTIYERMKVLGIPGVSIAVFDSGHIIWAKGYGLRDLERSLPVDTNTLFQAASVSKPLASAAMFKLVENNTLSLDEDVNLKLRGWKVPDNQYTTTEKVTLRRIVSHTAGLGVHGFSGYNQKDSIPTLAQILEGAPPANSPPVRVIALPGKKETYSGGAFTVMQLLMEETTGKPLGQLAQELVFAPVGMTHSTYTLPLPARFDTLVAKGYDDNKKQVEGGYHVFPEMAATGLWSTPSDLARFMLNIGNAYRGGDGLLKQATVQTMLTRSSGGSGHGFALDGKDSALCFWHSGSNAGFTAYAVSFEQIGRGVVIMTNSKKGMPFIHELLRAISKEYRWPSMWPKE
ncbi:class A beta-lactamase-related serine hydrolase [Paraflavitalea soli]|uniref:Class A beta-lactamase-related serine hydrolase n=1 Tax=Paraflavitalea soli TaxID=2315862 RepID=A0A3B7MK50_9BACT|nr:serine hydrolase domain-containing protein [Paraflavitalea soli]AXY73406.1 class A beta-lactamase-related serine hydrolase [Paraflavitalea soli]